VATEQSGQEGIKTTHLLTKANLSHSRLTKFIENLTGAGLINKIEYDGKNTFVITSKGRQYLESYKQFSNFTGSFGLEL
jgi:predicted transcriptional regulator